MILALDFGSKNCSVFSKIPEDFEFLDHASYLRVSNTKCLSIGGFQDGKPSNRVQSISFTNGEIKVAKLPDLNIGRCQPSVMFYNKVLYVSGGSSKPKNEDMLKSVECLGFG